MHGAKFLQFRSPQCLELMLHCFGGDRPFGSTSERFPRDGQKWYGVHSAMAFLAPYDAALVADSSFSQPPHQRL